MDAGFTESEFCCMKSMYVSHLSGTVMVKSVPPKRDGFGRVPSRVTSDPKLKDADCRIYEVLSQMERKGIIRAGVRIIGEACNKSRSAAARGIARLKKHGHLELVAAGNGKRSQYRLTDPIFSAATETYSPKRKPIIKPCSKCGQTCKPHRATGWCGKCVEMAREDKRREGMADTTRRKLAV